MKTMSRASGALALLLVLAPLTACSAEKDPAKAPSVEPVAPTESKKDEPARSDRGNLIKEVGQPAGIGPLDGGGPNTVDFVITNITVDAACTNEFAQTPMNGHFIRVDMDVTTTSEFDGLFMVQTNGVWKWVDANGTTANSDPATGSGYMCLNDAEMLPDTIGTGEKATGAVVLDVPTTEGFLVFSQGPDAGWEWAVPAP